MKKVPAMAKIGRGKRSQSSPQLVEEASAGRTEGDAEKQFIACAAWRRWRMLKKEVTTNHKDYSFQYVTIGKHKNDEF